MIDRNVFLSMRQRNIPTADYSGWSMKEDSIMLMRMFGALVVSSGAQKKVRAQSFDGACKINKEYSSFKKRRRRMRRFGDLGWDR